MAQAYKATLLCTDMVFVIACIRQLHEVIREFCVAHVAILVHIDFLEHFAQSLDLTAENKKKQTIHRSAREVIWKAEQARRETHLQCSLFGIFIASFRQSQLNKIHNVDFAVPIFARKHSQYDFHNFFSADLFLSSWRMYRMSSGEKSIIT
jgi:hypothetical protein